MKQESSHQRWEYQREKMSRTRDQKHQETKIYNEDQLLNAWDKFD